MGGMAPGRMAAGCFRHRPNLSLRRSRVEAARYTWNMECILNFVLENEYGYMDFLVMCVA